MTPYVDSLGIASEARGVLVDPGDTGTYLRRHHTEVPARLLHRNEVQCDVVRPGIDEHLGGIAVLFCGTHEPVAAMDEDEDRSVGAVGPINIELFNLSRSVCDTPRRTDPGAHGLTVAGESIGDLRDERFVVHLIVCGIEFELVVIHEYERALV